MFFLGVFYVTPRSYSIERSTPFFSYRAPQRRSDCLPRRRRRTAGGGEPPSSSFAAAFSFSSSSSPSFVFSSSFFILQGGGGEGGRRARPFLLLGADLDHRRLRLHHAVLELRGELLDHRTCFLVLEKVRSLEAVSLLGSIVRCKGDIRIQKTIYYTHKSVVKEPSLLRRAPCEGALLVEEPSWLRRAPFVVKETS